MTDQSTLRVNVNIELPEKALQIIVQQCKAHTGRNAKGHYRVDTADKVSELVSKYVQSEDFLKFINNPVHYTG